MSTDIYAGQLCATHISEGITHPETRWVVYEIRHSEPYRSSRVLCRSIDVPDDRRNFRALVLQPDDIVTTFNTHRHRTR